MQYLPSDLRQIPFGGIVVVVVVVVVVGTIVVVLVVLIVVSPMMAVPPEDLMITFLPLKVPVSLEVLALIIIVSQFTATAQAAATVEYGRDCVPSDGPLEPS